MRIAQLGLSNSESVFDLAMVHLDLPTIEVGLKQHGGGRFQVAGEQKSRIA